MAENASADTYTVQSGDTLSQIAANHNTTVDYFWLPTTTLLTLT